MYAKHFSDTLAGMVFSQTATPLGLAIPIYSATAIAGGMPLFNPPNSNVRVEVIRVELNRASGTADFGCIGVMAVALSAVASGAVCTAFADTTPINGYIGSGNATKCLSSNTGTVTVTAGTVGPPTSTAPGWIRTLAAINLEANTSTAHATSTSTYDFDGSLLVPPGVMIYFACTKASVALYSTSLVWKEIPISR